MDKLENLLHYGHEILIRLVAVSKNITIYPPQHPMVSESATEICELLKPLFAGSQRVNFNIVNSEIYFERQLLREESIKYSDFIQLLTECGINSLSFEPDISPKSLAVFLSLLTKAGKDESLRGRLKETQASGIDFERLFAFDPADGAYRLVKEKEESAAARNSYDKAMEQMEYVEKDIFAKRKMDPDALRTVVSSLMGDFLTDPGAMMGILSMKNYDEYLFHHSINVAIVSLLIASKLSMEENMVKTVGVSGLLHDIGKITIPREVLSKPGPLTEDEWTLMRRHPIEGAQILMRHEDLGGLPVLAALEHHAGYDLSGYPTLKGKEEPHAIARIVCIADVYEALTANRSYRPARGVQQAVDLLLDGAGKQFDPLLVKLLLNTVGVFPPGSMVRLKSGQTAVVVETNEDTPFSPKVRPVRDDNGEPTEGDIINTAEDPTRYAVVGIAESQEV